ncbi:MAG: class I SAM-dependent methyltransferase [Oscillospiraceae bacterium]|jgi:SAM-dependent methyltransferase|nr:class I SAM-dependent methyltransferase [Oscillospiraceae bacterium]
MSTAKPDWYKHAWTLDMKNMSWVEDTQTQVQFIIDELSLRGHERILDLACGYGRHALSFARKGFCVVGVDITKALIEDATQTAQAEQLNAAFLHADIRDLSFCNEFDVVLNLAEGAIGYLENDAENLKIFDVAARALKPGGRHFINICNAEHAEQNFPKRTWEAGEKELSIAEFSWNPATRRMSFGGRQFRYGKVMEEAPKSLLDGAHPIRLYSIHELQEIYAQRHMEILGAFSDFHGKALTSSELELVLFSKRL